jgi:hypothetical protein
MGFALQSFLLTAEPDAFPDVQCPLGVAFLNPRES